MSVRSVPLFCVLTVGVVLAGCSRTKTDNHTIQECAALLPKGDLYMLDIRGVIDTGVTPPAIEGGFEVMSEGASRDEMAAFSECMKAVIQPREGEESSITTSETGRQSRPDASRVPQEID